MAGRLNRAQTLSFEALMKCVVTGKAADPLGMHFLNGSFGPDF
jgi:hypothetical protein